MLAIRLNFTLLQFLLISPTLSKCGNILALFTTTQRSHHLVYGSILGALLERQHQVTVISTLPLTDTIERIDGTNPNLHYIQIKVQNLHKNVTNIENGFQKLQIMLQNIDRAGSLLQDTALRQFLRTERNTKFDLLLLGYSFNDYLLGVAAHFNCPVALIWPTQPISFINSLMGNPEERWYVTQPYDRFQYKGLNALAFGVFEKFIEIMAVERMRHIYDSNFPAAHYPSFDELCKNVSIVLCNHHSISEGPIAPYVPGIIEVGGIQSSAQSEVLPESLQSIFEDSQRHIVYLSLGSRVKWSALPPKYLQIFVNTFQRLVQSWPITIIWTYDGVCSDIEATNIVCAAWWPQNALLAQPQTKLFITHGGKGSLTEALQHGVPMLGLPFFGDQRANVAKMRHQGFGLQLDFLNLNERQLFDAIHEIIHQNMSFAANVKLFSQRYRDRPLTARDTAIYWLEYVMRHKGAAHLRSPLLDLNFLQYFLIDVYFALLCGCAVFILIVNWLERRLA